MAKAPVKQHVLVSVGENEGCLFRAVWYSLALVSIKELVYHSCWTYGKGNTMQFGDRW